MFKVNNKNTGIGLVDLNTSFFSLLHDTGPILESKDMHAVFQKKGKAVLKKGTTG